MTISLPQPGRTFDGVYQDLESRTSGSYPVGVNGMPHQGVHIPGPDPVFAVQAGTLVAYRLRKRLHEMILPGAHGMPPVYSDSFALIKHDYVTPKGAHLSYCSLYMHLLPWGEEGDTGSASAPTALPAMTPKQRELSLFGADRYTVTSDERPSQADWHELKQSGAPAAGLLVYETGEPNAALAGFLKRGEGIVFREPNGARAALKDPAGKPLELAEGGFIRPTAGSIKASRLIPHLVFDAVENVNIPLDEGTLIGYPSPGFQGDYVHLEVMVPDITTLKSHDETWGRTVPPHLTPGSSYDAPSWFTQAKEDLKPWIRVDVAVLLATLGIEVPDDIVQIGQALGYDRAVGPVLRKVSTSSRSEWDSQTQTGLELRLEKDYKMTPAAAKAYAEHVRDMSFVQKLNPPLPATTHHVHPITFIKQVGDLRGITFKQLAKIAYLGNPSAINVKELLEPLNVMMDRYEIHAGRERQCHFLAQVMVECWYLLELAEWGSMGSNLPDSSEPEGYIRIMFHAGSSDGETADSYYQGRDPYYANYLSHIGRLGNMDLHDAVKFRGRGLLQVTGRSNYAEYWNYLKTGQQSAITPWWEHLTVVPKGDVYPQLPLPADRFPPNHPNNPPGTMEFSSPKEYLAKKNQWQNDWAAAFAAYWDWGYAVPDVPADWPERAKKAYAEAADIPNPQLLSTDFYHACNSAGWFWDKKSHLNTVVDAHYADPKKSKDPGWNDHVVAVITRVINGGETGLKERRRAYHRIKTILMPDS